MTKKPPEMQIDPSLIHDAVKSIEERAQLKEEEKGSRLIQGIDKSKVEEKEKQDENYEKLIRLAADFDNFRKRTQKEKAELVRYSNENLIRELLPILDNFERAVEHAKKSNEVEAIRTGVELILSQLNTMLDRFGVNYRTMKGARFDPLIHEAVSHISSTDHPPNTIIEEHQKAYFLHGRLIRPALVTVSKAETESTDTKGSKQELETDQLDLNRAPEAADNSKNNQPKD